MTFADVTIVPVAGDCEAAHLASSRRMADVHREHGATRVVDHWQAEGPVDHADFHAEGMAHEQGELSDLARIAGAFESEPVVVTITEWPSREARDGGRRPPPPTPASWPPWTRTPSSTGGV